MKFTLAFLATLVLGGSAVSLTRSKNVQPFSQSDEQWNSQVPEIANPKVSERTYKEGNEYRYLYDSQILTGMPDVHLQFSGARIRAIVKIQNVAGTKDLMQIEKVFVGSLHERFVSEPRAIIQLDAFEPMQEQDAPFEEVLRKPVRFTMENGKIDDFETVEDDPSWSINIKRAILNTFHLSLVDKEEPKDETRREAISQRSERTNEVRSRQSGASGSQSSDDEDNYYTVVEDSIAGRCEVSYLVLEQPDQPEEIYPIFDNENETAPSGSRGPASRRGAQSGSPQQSLNVLNVTKTFDYRNCEFQPFVFKGLHVNRACPGCDSDPESFMDILESAAHTRYNITGTRSNFLIDSAITEAVYKVTPRSHFAGSMMAYANITVVLIQSGPSKAAISFPGAGNVIDGLHMINPKFDKREGDKYMYKSPEADKPIVQLKKYWPNAEDKPRKIKALFEKLVHGMEEKEVKGDTAVLVEYIVHFLEFAIDDELVAIHNEVKNVNVPGVEKEEIERLFIDLLISTGTKCTFNYVKKLVSEKKIEGSVAIDALTALPFRMDIDKMDGELLLDMRTLCLNDNMKHSVLLQRACWLSYGTLVHKACVHPHFSAEGREADWANNRQTSSDAQSGPKRSSMTRQPERRSSQPESNQPGSQQEERENKWCPADVRQQIVDGVTQKLKAVGTDHDEKITLIKVIGNMGLPETVDELATIAEDESEPIYVRTQAIYAMRILNLKYQPEQVLETLMPLYRQSKNPTQVRIAAFLTILTAKPDLAVLEDIAQSLNREVDLDVASYVYSSLSSVANSTDPCLKNLSRDALLALQFTTPINVEWRHSKVSSAGTYLDHMKSGLFVETTHIMGKDAPAPRAATFRLHANINEKSLDIVEFGYEIERLGSTFHKIMGNLSTEAIAEVLAGRAPRRHPRSADQSAPVQSIAEIDRLLSFPSKTEKPLRGTAYIKLFGQETLFAVINPNTVSRFIVDLMAQQEGVMTKIASPAGMNMDHRRAGMLIDTKVEFPTVLGVPIGFTVRLPVVSSVKGNLKGSMEPKPEGGIMSILKKGIEKLTVETKIKSNIAAEIHAKLSVYLGFLRIGTGVRTKLSMNIPMAMKAEMTQKDRSTKVSMDLPEAPLKLVKTVTYPITFVQRMSKNAVTYQPKAIPQGLEGTKRQGQPGGASSSEEERRNPEQQTQFRRKVDQALHFEVEDVETELITKSGRVHFPKSFTSLPVAIPEIWEIATPAFVKSRDIDFQIGHESQAFKINVEVDSELPNTRLAPMLLPTLGSKCEFEVKLTPKAGVKKVTVTIFERSEFSLKAEPELMNKLKDKVEGITIKPLEKPSTPPNYEKIPKIGYSLQILVAGDGSDAPTAWTTRYLMAVLYSVDRRYLKLVGAMESKVPAMAKKASFNAEMLYPDRTGLWFVTPQDSLNRSIQGQAELQWGDELSAEKQIKIRMRYQKTQEQMQVEKQDLYDVNGIPVPWEIASEVREGDALFKSLFEECEEDRRIGAPFSKECVDLAIRYADLLKLKVDIDYKNVSPAVRRVLNRLEAITKGVYYWNTEVEDVDVKNPDNKVNAVIEYSADRSYVDIKYQTPTQNVSIMNIDLPMDVQPPSALFPWSPARLVGLVTAPSCTISGPKINTFDDVSDFMPLSQCYHVMVKDATKDNLFAVLVANAAKNSLAKKVLIMFEGHTIELVPKTEGSAPTPTAQQPIDVKTQYVVKYNGQVLADALNPEKRTTIPPNSPEDKQELADVMLVKPENSGNKVDIIGVVSHVTGIKVLFDGSSVTVMPSPFWKNHVVGLCGTYTAQTWDEKLLPNKTLVEEPVDFSRAFQLNVQGCDKEISPIPQEEATPRRRV